MLIHLHVERKYEYKPLAWTIVICPCCQQPGPATVEEEFLTVTVAGTRVSSVYQGTVFRCDICRRLVSPPENEIVPLDSWTPADEALT